MNETLKNEIERCTTKKSLLALLKKNGIKARVGDCNGDFWISDLVRIYKPYKQKNYKVQRWQKVKLEYSGIPTFFTTGLPPV